MRMLFDIAHLDFITKLSICQISDISNYQIIFTECKI